MLPSSEQVVNVMTEASEDEEDILAATDEIEIEVAADTGAGAHCCNPRPLSRCRIIYNVHTGLRDCEQPGAG